MTKLISRTVCETLYDVMALNIKTKEVRNISVNVGSMTFKDYTKALDFIRTEHDTDTVKAVAIVGKSERNKLYVMREVDFIKAAVQVDDMKAARAYFKKTMGIEDIEEDAAE